DRAMRVSEEKRRRRHRQRGVRSEEKRARDQEKEPASLTREGRQHAGDEPEERKRERHDTKMRSRSSSHQSIQLIVDITFSYDWLVIESLRHFALVAQHGTFTAAARHA